MEAILPPLPAGADRVSSLLPSWWFGRKSFKRDRLATRADVCFPTRAWRNWRRTQAWAADRGALGANLVVRSCTRPVAALRSASRGALGVVGPPPQARRQDDPLAGAEFRANSGARAARVVREAESWRRHSCRRSRSAQARRNVLGLTKRLPLSKRAGSEG
jgi:hypothetical protein